MFSRACFTSQFRDYSRSIKNNRNLFQQRKLKLSTTVVLRSEKEYDVKGSLKVIRNDGVLAKSASLRRIKQFFTRTNVGSLGAAGLILDLDRDVVEKASENSTLISDATEQTVSRILDTAAIATNDENLIQTTSDFLTQPSQVTTESVASTTETVASTTETVAEATIISSHPNTIDAPTSISGSPTIDPIPEPPPIPEFIPVQEVVEQLNALGQPTFASMGLGGWTPVGIIQNCFEFLNVTAGVPWWAAIALGTVVIRLAMFPIVIVSQRNAAKMNNNLPGLQAIQLKLTEARQCGNQLEAAKYSQEMMIFMKDKELNPLKNVLVPLVQMPVFLSFFISLRQMANVPVDSLKTGGMLWFTDLTLPDQYFLLPIITSATLWLTIELGADTAKLSSQNMQLMKYVFRALPVIVLPFTINFPGAILVYWASSNFVSLAQVGFLKIPSVREYFAIDKAVKIDQTSLPIKPKGFREGLKESWSNMKIAKELEERRRLDELQFRRAGKGPIVKTFKYDPTKQTNPNTSAPISAKKR